MWLATAGRSLGSERPFALAHASASASFPIRMSVYGRICWSWAPKNWGMNGADKFSTKV